MKLLQKFAVSIEGQLNHNRENGIGGFGNVYRSYSLKAAVNLRSKSKMLREDRRAEKERLLQKWSAAGGEVRRQFHSYSKIEPEISSGCRSIKSKASRIFS